MDRELMERQVLVRKELAARLDSDPWWQWQPLKHQRAYIESIMLGQTQEAWLVCANRSGKTDAACYLGAGLARFGRQNPKYQISHGGRVVVESYATKGWVVSNTSNASREVVQPKYFGAVGSGTHAPFIPEREIDGKFNINEQTLRLKNGSLIGFKTAEAKTISFAGAGLDWVQIDEELEKPKYDELTMRVEGGKRLLIFGACTLLPPEGQVGGVSWMFPVIIKPFMANPHACGYMVFGASIYDNPYILPEEVARLEARYPVGSTERAIRLDGQWLPGLQGARAYTGFDARVHVRPQGPLIMRRPVVWCLDFNVEPMVTLIGQRDDKIFRIHHELVLDTDASIDGMFQYFHEIVPTHHGEVWIYGDATGKARSSQTGRSEYQLLQNLMRTYGSPYRLKVPEVNPLVSDRINAVNRVFRDEQGESRVEVDPSCVELIEDFEQVLRDHRGGLKKVHNRKDPYARRTHSSDAFGYWVAYEEPVRATSIGQRIVRAIKNPGYGFGRA